MAGTGIAGLMITFLGGILFIMVLTIVIIVCYKKKVEKTSAPFPQVIQEAAVEAAPESEDFEKLLVMGVKDAVQAIKGYERIQSGYDSVPNYIVCYRGDEMYIMTARFSSRKEIRVDKDLILHFRKEQIREIKISGGKVLIFFKDSKQFFAMAASRVLIAPQTESYEAFMKYIKNLAAEIQAQH